MKLINRLTYAVEVECSEEGTRHWRHPWCHDKNGGELSLLPPLLKETGLAPTIANCISASAAKYGPSPCMGTRPIKECTIEGKKMYWSKSDYDWKTYKQVYDDINSVAAGLLNLDFVRARRDAGNECIVAMLAETSADWQTAAQGCLKCGITLTTVYTTLGHEAMLHGLNESEACVIFMDWQQYDVLKDTVIANCPAIKQIVVMGRCFTPLCTVGGDSKKFPTAEIAADLPKIGEATTTTLEALIRVGTSSARDVEKYLPGPDDIAFIMYTSGSTGLPKGVVITHKNMVSVVASINDQGVVSPKPGERYIAYLPLAHILELLVETMCLCQGASIGYGHPRTLTSSSPYMHPSNPEGSDLLACRPTLMAAVPAILDQIKAGLCMKLGTLPGLKGKLVRGAVSKSLGQSANEGALAGCVLSLGLGPKLLKKVKAGLGLENLRCFVSGGAPLSPETQEYITAVLAPVAQGYGATETVGCASVQEVLPSGGRPQDVGTGHVGAIQPASEIKLVSVPEMGYLVTDTPCPRGEILVSGHNLTKGYYKMPEKTFEDFQCHADGKTWFHTGDIGVLTENGNLKIVDRKKDLIKLSGGDYVSLGKVEAALKQVLGIGACCVFAQSDKDHCVCIVSQPEKGWASVGGKPEEAALTASIEKTLRAMKLARFEIPTKVKVDDLIWLPEAGLVTASLKVQRNPLRTHYTAAGGLLEQMNYQFPKSN